MKVVGVRGLDEELYRRVKAAAALRGIRVSDAFEEALRLWLSVKLEVVAELEEVEREAELNRKCFTELREKLLKEYPGLYAAFACGRFLGVYPSFDEAAAAVEAVGSKHGIVEHIVEAEVGRKRVELGWSLVEM